MSDETLVSRWQRVRARTEALAAPLSAEDLCVQSMPDASPGKWHLGHVSWFFEVLVLARVRPGHACWRPEWLPLFNSYYESLGRRHPRPQRGLLTRPGLDEVMAYRRHVDDAMQEWLTQPGDWHALVGLGLAHEEQHQELMLTDIKHLLAQNPLMPVYDAQAETFEPLAIGATGWIDGPDGLVTIGHAGPAFAFDNVSPRHRVWLAPYQLASRPVSCADWLAFMEDGGYRQPGWWLSDGWAWVQREAVHAPLYWFRGESGWWRFSLAGPVPVAGPEPVAHVSFYEAAAYAAWAGARLPTEEEWEGLAAARQLPATGQVWEWTRSAYAPYPGFRPFDGAAAEYNGKFMVGQQVLRGGSLATPPGHVRASYRNFFAPDARWQFSGLRLARDIQS